MTFIQRYDILLVCDRGALIGYVHREVQHPKSFTSLSFAVDLGLTSDCGIALALGCVSEKGACENAVVDDMVGSTGASKTCHACGGAFMSRAG